jgi:hypothetical protein
MINLFDIFLRKNIYINIELYRVNNILNQHWNWMENNKGGKIVVKQVNLKDFYGLNIK